jgi:flagellar biosynthesis/type III secretory pathway M-ring protein FliF/YscJ
MKNNERLWKTLEIVFGAIGTALLVLILVLKFMGKDVAVLTYPIIAIVILFLICDEIARSIRRRREKEEAAKEANEHPQEPETTLPKDAFEFEDKPEEPKP